MKVQLQRKDESFEAVLLEGVEVIDKIVLSLKYSPDNLLEAYKLAIKKFLEKSELRPSQAMALLRHHINPPTNEHFKLMAKKSVAARKLKQKL